MILIIGGYAAGKRSYVREQLGYTDAQIADGVLNDLPVVCNAQDLALTCPTETLLPALLKKDVVIINEMGAGVIPMEKEQRMAREAGGRLAILLAQNARQVIRIVCGLPQILK